MATIFALISNPVYLCDYPGYVGQTFGKQNGNNQDLSADALLYIIWAH